jgi:tetratricopeptide (TPR) repeat protein
VYNRWASTLNGLGRYEEAVTKGELAYELDSLDPASSFSLGVAYRGLGEYDRAISKLRMAVAVDPEYHEAVNEWGSVLYDQGEYAEAAEQFLRAIELAPVKYRYHSNLGRAYYMLERYEDAADQFMVATVLGLRATDFYNWGRALYELGRFEEAASKHEWAVELDPDNPLYHYHLGYTYYRLNDTERAIEELEKAAELAASQGNDELLRYVEEALAQIR